MRLSLSQLVPLTHTQVCIVAGSLHSRGDGQRQGRGPSISGGKPDGTDSYLHTITPTQSRNMSEDDILDIILGDTKDQEFWAHVGMSFAFVLAVCILINQTCSLGLQVLSHQTCLFNLSIARPFYSSGSVLQHRTICQ